MLPSRSASRAAAVLVLAPTLLGGCAGDVSPIKAAFVQAGYGPKPVPAPDFVASTRREGLGYMPVGQDAPRRERARSAEARRALEAELEGARSRNEARGRAAEGAAKGVAKGTAKDMSKGAAQGTGDPGATE